MDISQRKEALHILNTPSSEIDTLLNYTFNAFVSCVPDDNDSFMERWKPIAKCADIDGAAVALNRYLAPKELQIQFSSPQSIEMKLFQSVGGIIPIIEVKNTTDFEAIIRNIVYKGKDVPNIVEMGASFAFGKYIRFIVLSDKPYANIPANVMGLDERVWKEKSLIIRRHHECTHYFTKRFFNSSKNNLHDELIADFCGFYAAFGEYKADWFLRCMGLIESPDGSKGRIRLYTSGLSNQAIRVVARLAKIVTMSLEVWSRSAQFIILSETARLKILCEKELLAYPNVLT